MRIIINAIPLLSQKTGIGRYIYNLFKYLTEYDESNCYNFFYGISNKDTLIDTPKNDIDLKKVWARKIGLKNRELLYHIIGSYFYFKGCIERYDIYHETNYIPFNFRGRVITNVFDLSLLLFPETQPKERLKHFEKHFYNRLNRSAKIIAASNYIKREISEKLGISASRVVSIPLAAERKFQVLDKDRVALYLKENGFPTDYILYLGAIEPRKNLRLLIKGFNNLKEEFKYFLIIGGPKSWLWEGDMKLIEELGIKNRVLVPGYIPDEDLPYLYNGARLFVYPSLYEGFGLPVLEAMACGIPVITSNSSSLPETVGDGGLMVDPQREDELTEAMRLILRDSELQMEMKRRGLNQARKFSWEETGKKTLKIYKETYWEKG